nr:phosphotransferase [Pseudomaricurvus alcaniphilus]
MLKESLVGKIIPTGFAHGDLNAKNVLFDEKDYQLTGVIDWDSVTYDELPLRDLIHFLVSIYRYRDEISYGAAIVSLIAGEEKFESALILSHAADMGVPREFINSMLTICWLRYLADTLTFNQNAIDDNRKVNKLFWTASELVDNLRGELPA